MQLGTFYTVMNITDAANVFKANNCSSTKDQDAVACLAAQLLATKLNLANGSLACPTILQTVTDAQNFLTGVNYTGPGGKYTLNSLQRAQAISLKSKLDAYNNNIGCP